MLEMLEREREMYGRNVRERERALCSKCSFYVLSPLCLREQDQRTSGSAIAGLFVRLCVEIAGFATKHTIVLQSVTRTCVSDSVVPEF